MSNNPASEVDVHQPHSSGMPESKAPSDRNTSKSSRSSSTVKAQKAAAEALALRRRMEREQELAERERAREQELAERERERERHLAALQQQLEESELQAELADIEANAAADRSCTGSRVSHRNSTRVSVERTIRWVENQSKIHISKGTIAVGCEQHDSATSPGHSVPPPMATRATAAELSPIIRHTQRNSVTKASEAVGHATPLISTELDKPSVLMQAIADTASAAMALASASSTKKLELPLFHGNPMQWLQFKRNYNVTKTNFSSLDNMNRLDAALRGPAREAVAALLLSTEDPDEVMRALEDNFARPELIVFKEVSGLKNLPRLGNDLRELSTITNRVRNSISTIKLLNHTEYLFSPELFHAVLAKLNPTMKFRWTDYAMLDTTNRPKLEIMSDFLKQELDRHIRFGLSPDSCSTHQQLVSIDKSFKRENIHNAFTNSKHDTNPGGTKKQQCVFCRNDHNIKECGKFKSLHVDDRWRWLREAKVCYRCLRSSSHQWKTCKVNPCGVDGCSFRHSPLLHRKPPPPVINALDTQVPDNNACPVTVVSDSHPISNQFIPTEEKIVISTISTGIQEPCSILALRPRAYLKIIPVTVSGPTGTCDVFALLDDGSTATLIDSSIASCIGATGPQQTITINGVNGLTRNTKVSYVNFYIKGRYTQDTFLVKNARSIESLSLRPQTIKRETIESYSHLTDLVDVLTYDDATPTILIGAEHWHLSLNREARVGRRNDPVACFTALGWTLYGVASSNTKLVDFINHTHIDITQDENLESLIRDQYKLDSIGIMRTESQGSKLDRKAIEILESTCRRLPTGRFEVGMPWRDNITHVPDSYPQAMSRFLSLEKRMSKEVDFARAYNTFMTNMVTKGYAEECDPDTYNGNKSERLRFYLPHFGVYHPQKKKIRVVHDAAAKNDGVSLNSLLLPGPDLLQPLLKILFRFREGRIGISADIREMFPQVRIREQDRDALRYLWRSDKTQPIKEFRMTSVIFGACCSPFIAQFVKNKNASEHENKFPKAAAAILFSHYMDDFIDSYDNNDEAAQLAADIISVHSAASFEMRDWISNDSDVLKLIPNNLRAPQSLEVELGQSTNSVRALGLVWDPTSDNLGFQTGLITIDSIPSPLTKRKVLSHLMRVYDPLGLLGPLVIRGRILFQQTWRTNIDWDTELPNTEASKWFDWFQELAKVSSLKITRWYAKASGSEPSYRELHIFADASELAYACVAYWRLIYPDGTVKLTLVASKQKVSPLKPTSIPRLELQAALIASRLALVIKDSHRKTPVRSFFWTDSMTVLQWLRSDARIFKPFVALRLGEILENSAVKDWRWVPTDFNVADDATRIRPIELNITHRWFCGPSFLSKSPEDWPTEPLSVAPVREEIKTCHRNELVGLESLNVTSVCEDIKCDRNELVRLTSVSTDIPTPVTANLTRFSCWLRLLRATARIHQVVSIFGTYLTTIRNNKLNGIVYSRHRKQSASTTLSPLDSSLIKVAEKHVLQQSQIDSFSQEFLCILRGKPLPTKSHLNKLSPVLGEDGLLHLAGRIKSAEDIDPDSRYPILLDGRHPAVRLLVQYYHRRAGHANHESVINEIRQRFWLLRLRDTVRLVAKQCLFCKIRKTQPMNPVTGDLPRQRLSHHQKAFTFTGLDYFGPINITIGRRHEKRYTALFTCLTTRAIHLELVHSLSADSAIMAIRRFTARRGNPNTIYSDNGTAFVGANRILREFYANEVLDYVATKQIKWSFIPAAAPTFGGCWERLVRTVKVALNATLKERYPKEETLLTLLAEAEAIVNSRPLTHVSSDPEDPTTLTPFHFLIGSSSDQNVTRTLNDGELVGRTEWRKAIRLADHFWNRWVREVLPTMQPRTVGRADGSEQDLLVGDVVIIVDESLPRGLWPRGRITKLFPGKDGVTRVVDVATPGGTLRRPLKKLVKITT